MARRLRVMVLLATASLATGACSGADDTTASTTVAPPPTTAGTTTTAPSTTTTDAPDTPTTLPPTTAGEATDAVGDMTQTHQEIQAQLEIARTVSSIPEDAVAYLPDLSNADPIVALQEAWHFENWLISVNPNPEWLRFYVLPDSPYAREAESELANWVRNNWRVEDFSDSYYFEDAAVVRMDEVTLPDDVRLNLSPGAEAVIYTEGAGQRIVIDRSTGDQVDTWAAYGPDRVLTVLVPTAEGWRVFYSEIGYAE